MNKKIKILLYLTFSLFLLLYGVAAGHYGLFPYPQLLELRDSVLFDQLKTQTLRASGAQSSKPAQAIQTSLQRLLVKEVKLEVNPGLTSNYIAAAGNVLYTISTHGHFRIFDLSTHQLSKNAPDPVPMNIEDLMNSEIIDMEDFSLHHFRVLDVYAEEKTEGIHSIFATHYRYDDTNECISFTVSRAVYSPVQGKMIEGWQTLFTGTPCLYPEKTEQGNDRFRIRLTSGGNIISFDDQHLLVSAGDHGFDGVIKESLSKMPESMPGKMILIHKETGDFSYYAEGIRNSQGMYRDRNGTIWATDHGPQGGDELNIIREGRHYGWPEVTYGIEYGNEPWPHSGSQGIHEGYEKPVHVWMNTIAPAGIIRLEETKKFTLWEGDLLIASLRSQSLHRIRIDENNQVLYSEEIPLGHRIRDIAQLPDGTLALMADDKTLIIIDDGGPVYEDPGEELDEKIEAMEMYNRLVE